MQSITAAHCQCVFEVIQSPSTFCKASHTTIYLQMFCFGERFNFVNFLQHSRQCYLLVSKLSNFMDAYWQNSWFAVVSCMLFIESRLYSFLKKTPYKKEQSYALLFLKQRKMSNQFQPYLKGSCPTTIPYMITPLKDKEDVDILIEDFSQVEKELTMKKYSESLQKMKEVIFEHGF